MSNAQWHDDQSAGEAAMRKWEKEREQARKLFFDTLVFDTATLRHLAASFGTSQLMLGTDYPFNFHDHEPVARLDAAGFDPATRELMLRGNARRFLGAAHVSA